MLRSGSTELFEAQLLRLKECLGVTKDTEVAAALGLSKAGLWNRKQAGSFPEERVVLLKKKRPELDVMYVLTGEKWASDEMLMVKPFMEAAAYLEDLSLAASAVRAAKNHSQALRDAANDPQIRELLGILIFCDRQAIVEVLILAAKLMGPTPMPFATRPPPTVELLGSPDQAGLSLQDEAHRSTASSPAKVRRALKQASKAVQGSAAISVTGVPRSKPERNSSGASKRAKRTGQKA